MINCFADISCPLTYFLKMNTMYELKMKKFANIRTKHCAILSLYFSVTFVPIIEITICASI